eukprot:316196-Hanusia_phi.AAC.1
MYINSLAHCPVVAHSDAFKEFLELNRWERGGEAEDDEELTWAWQLTIGSRRGSRWSDWQRLPRCERVELIRVFRLTSCGRPLRSSVQAENSTSSVPTPQVSAQHAGSGTLMSSTLMS